MAAAEAWGAACDLRCLTVETGAANQSARSFYAVLGYREEDVRADQDHWEGNGVAFAIPAARAARWLRPDQRVPRQRQADRIRSTCTCSQRLAGPRTGTPGRSSPAAGRRSRRPRGGPPTPSSCTHITPSAPP